MNYEKLPNFRIKCPIPKNRFRPKIPLLSHIREHGNIFTIILGEGDKLDGIDAGASSGMEEIHEKVQCKRMSSFWSPWAVKDE